jgi:hypothetical protein
MTFESPYAKASRFFGNAYNQLEGASQNQVRAGGFATREEGYSANADDTYMEGAVPPRTGTSPVAERDTYDIESIKEELLSSAKEQKRPSNGSVVIRAGGGYNPAVKG